MRFKKRNQSSIKWRKTILKKRERAETLYAIPYYRQFRDMHYLFFRRCELCVRKGETHIYWKRLLVDVLSVAEINSRKLSFLSQNRKRNRTFWQKFSPSFKNCTLHTVLISNEALVKAFDHNYAPKRGWMKRGNTLCIAPW